MGFVDYIISDMIEAWDGSFLLSTFFSFKPHRAHSKFHFSVCFAVFIDMPQMVTYMQQNYERWKEYNVSILPFLFTVLR